MSSDATLFDRISKRLAKVEAHSLHADTEREELRETVAQLDEAMEELLDRLIELEKQK